ncbi:hypothetical protein TNCV_1750631 [Trichonephila clavipes]|nr:hypothetical protein TNCV_1750631 [Trichonephila clavipes]
MHSIEFGELDCLKSWFPVALLVTYINGLRVFLTKDLLVLELIPKPVPGINILFADDMVMGATGSDIFWLGGYPLDKWLHVYTDGSAEDALKNAGAFSSAFSISYPVGKYYDNFDGEIAAISFVIDKLENCSECNIVFIDSQAAILSLINSS